MRKSDLLGQSTWEISIANRPGSISGTSVTTDPDATLEEVLASYVPMPLDDLYRSGGVVSCKQCRRVGRSIKWIIIRSIRVFPDTDCRRPQTNWDLREMLTPYQTHVRDQLVQDRIVEDIMSGGQFPFPGHTYSNPIYRKESEMNWNDHINYLLTLNPTTSQRKFLESVQRLIELNSICYPTTSQRDRLRQIGGKLIRDAAREVLGESYDCLAV